MLNKDGAISYPALLHPAWLGWLLCISDTPGIAKKPDQTTFALLWAHVGQNTVYKYRYVTGKQVYR